MVKIVAAVLIVAGSVVNAQSVSYADAIIPQVPAGCGWTFNIVLMNLSNRGIDFRVNFWKPAGIDRPGDQAQPREIAIQGIGRTHSVTGTIPIGGAYAINSDDSERFSTDCNGWAEVNSEELVGGYVVLNQKTTVESQQTIGGIGVTQVTQFSVDATVPFVSRFASRFLVPFNTMSYVSSIALVNPSFQTPAEVQVSYRDERGIGICQEVRKLKPGEQQSYILGGDAASPCGAGYSLLQNLRGVVEFSTSNLELSGVAFGFGALGFVSFPAQSSVGR